MFVSIVVLNWNEPEHTVACLHSLMATGTQDRMTVLAVDNGSADDSVARLRISFPEIEIVETGINLGYAGGNNVGIQRALAAGAEAVCILNNDVIVEPDFLAPLLAALQGQPDVGVVTPLVAEQGEKGGHVWALGSAVNWRTAEVMRRHGGEPVAPWLQRASFEVDVASGAAMLVKREVFERVGMMDEAFFLYFEEVDWSLTVRQAGYRILAVPTSVVWHRVSATLGTTSPAIDYYMLRNHLRLIGRHWSGVRRIYLGGRVVLRNLFAVAAFTVKSHSGQRTPNRDARLLALRDALLGRLGKMGSDVAAVCYPDR
ncbi:MAG: glycosyltransferase family 2 protein [Anaerolineae bacterium]|nr:glycosyltransferase family 2 protein [Anaerolineae bacterium]